MALLSGTTLSDVGSMKEAVRAEYYSGVDLSG
jgi:hypothetical protein